MDLTRIATVAAGEAIRQDVGLDGLVRLLTAYDDAYSTSKSRLPDVRYILELGETVEPGVNFRGYRLGPVTFRNGGSSANSQDIPGLVAKLVQNIPRIEEQPGFIEAANRWTRDFLWIHPFGDGNGRVAWILHNWITDRLDSPVSLPDFGW